MSDFDKEAERERLREKYENEREDREVTARMSELLLQGATMTNAHCRDCGDPIFRYDGQEFCPTCEKPVDRGNGGEAAEDEDAPEGDAKEDGDHIEVASPSEEARVRFGDDAADDEQPAADRSTESRRQRAAGAPADRDAAEAGTARPAPEDATELSASRAELHRRLRDLSQRAGACEDPRDAEAFLAAAREAAEALSALRR